MIEEFFKAHQHTIAAIAAGSTFAAVLTSLWLAWRARRADQTKLKAVATLVYDTIDQESAPLNLQVTITNRGKFPLRARSFFWKLPFGDEIEPTKLVDSYVERRTPIEIAPRASDTVTLFNRDTLKCLAKRMRGAATLADRLRVRFVRVYVETDDGQRFRVKLSSKVHTWLGRPEPAPRYNIPKPRPPQSHNERPPLP
jgi:hypothetical protein